MKNIIEKLKKFKKILPDAEYSQRSKLVILATSFSSDEPGARFKFLENIIESLKKFRQIQPDPGYSRISKAAILAAPVVYRKLPLFNRQLVFTVAGLLLVLISGNLMHNSNLKPTAPNLNAQALETEFKNLNIDIQLAKIDYSQKTSETVSLALKEITSKQTSHLNPIILESEQTQLNSDTSNNKDIDNLLDQILL
ncbi:MAG: hypothetical protein Q8N22_02310 [bacterium]|nr:hypothetical protein [bacterium]